METPEQAQERIIERFASCGDALDQFDQLLKLSAELEELEDTLKSDDALVDGCQSQVWLYVDWPDGTLRLRGDSDTLMVRGVIRIFQIMFEGRSPDAVLACPLRFVEETELASIFDAKRKTGVASIWEVVRSSALEQQRKTGSCA